MKHKPRKQTDKSILRSMLLNINEGITFTHEDLNLSKEKFNAYISALIKQGIIACDTDLPITSSKSLIISNIPLFESWKNNIYKKIEQFIIPIIPAIITIAATAFIK